jgi:hypothetical protein
MTMEAWELAAAFLVCMGVGIVLGLWFYDR